MEMISTKSVRKDLVSEKTKIYKVMLDSSDKEVFIDMNSGLLYENENEKEKEIPVPIGLARKNKNGYVLFNIVKFNNTWYYQVFSSLLH